MFNQIPFSEQFTITNLNAGVNLTVYKVNSFDFLRIETIGFILSNSSNTIVYNHVKRAGVLYGVHNLTVNASSVPAFILINLMLKRNDEYDIVINVSLSSYELRLLFSGMAFIKNDDK